MPIPISARWTLEQLCATSHGPNPLTATDRYGAHLSAGQIHLNLAHLALTLLDPLTEAWGWRVSSCYRSPAVNAAVGGASNSAHVAGLACDGAPSPGRGGFPDVIRWLAAQPRPALDRVIFEVRGATRWLHVQALAPGAPAQKSGWFFSPRAGAYLLTNPEALAGIAA
jgi:hypothetical protein